MSVVFRDYLKAGDLDSLAGVMRSTGLFYDFETDVALEVLGSCLDQGEASGYYCLVAEKDNICAGYAVYGPTPCTLSSWDIYWMAVSKNLQGIGLGSDLMTRVQQNIILLGGTLIWIETSGRAAYLPTRKFYEKHHYLRMAELPDFYAPGDGKVIYGKKVCFF
jgi:GNAT superfamily N-acetyltransferase